MTCQDLKPLLSEYIDQALDSAHSSEAQAHLGQCGGCARELELLRGVGGLLRGLTRQPLPSGFMARFEKKRAGAAARSIVTPRLVLAYALSALFMGVVFFRATRQAPMPQRAFLPEPMAEVAQSPTARTRPAPFRDTGGPLGKAAGPREAPILPEPAENRLSAPGRASLAGEGAPAFTPSHSQNYDNTQQASKMKQESADLGIQSINQSDDQPQAEPFMGRHMGTPEVAQRADASVQRLIAMRHSIEDASGKPKPVPIAGQTAPILYDQQKDQGNGQSLDEAASVGAWQGDFSGGNEGSRTISDAVAWRQLWGTLSAGTAVPDIDFSRQEVVAIFLGQRPSGGYSVEIVNVAADETSVTVRWRERTPTAGIPPSDGTTTPYALRVIAKSDLPVRFEKNP